MLRFIYVIIANLFRAPWIIPKMRRMASHPDRYTISERYALAQQMIRYMSASGRISTEVYGIENLPDKGGYIMFPNHQGKYDALGIISTHPSPPKNISRRLMPRNIRHQRKRKVG